MTKIAMFLTLESFTSNPLSGFSLGELVEWRTQTEFKKLCRTGINLARVWFNRNIFQRRDTIVDGVLMHRIGWGARQYLDQFYNNPHADIRLIEQQLRHSMEWWYPRVLLWHVTDAVGVSDLAKLVIRYAQNA